mmetsp:Transcript_6482/g.10619  ORF Transcript_6482/g.10619 Transcript_6482/m.10619 type:complete len:122 (-) Transcript_6482:633-998(-)
MSGTSNMHGLPRACHTLLTYCKSGGIPVMWDQAFQVIMKNISPGKNGEVIDRTERREEQRHICTIHSSSSLRPMKTSAALIPCSAKKLITFSIAVLCLKLKPPLRYHLGESKAKGHPHSPT